MKTLKTLVLIGALAAAASTAMAASISGSIGFAGTFSTDNNADLSLSTKFTSFGGPVHVISRSDDYSPVPVLSTGDAGITMALFQYAPSGSETATPFTLWSFTQGGTVYNFTLTSFSLTFANANSLILDGTGIAHIDGFTDTVGTWHFASGSSGANEFHFSAGNTVPDGGATAMLLGLGVLGLGALRRRIA